MLHGGHQLVASLWCWAVIVWWVNLSFSLETAAAEKEADEAKSTKTKQENKTNKL